SRSRSSATEQDLAIPRIRARRMPAPRMRAVFRAPQAANHKRDVPVRKPVPSGSGTGGSASQRGAAASTMPRFRIDDFFCL
ncbi:hypothetical protein NUV26_34605, partial [Burkholderia pseudomultivorans]|uniref:hypothetical protein n=1 Tax=Burkholderia pseudomultivorans TaxID=1207504 RepID=UPI002874E28B